jgi:ATP-dependent protease ClpP protease subunit
VTHHWRQLRMQALAAGMAPRASRLRSELTADGAGEIWLYDVIDPYGGFWGISAAEIVQALQAVGDGPVTVHINSPGGDVFEAIAIYNNFRAHKGLVTMVVEGVAASAASVVMAAGNRVEVAPNAQVMIHDGWGYVDGNQEKVHKYGDLLDRTSQNMAGMYAAKGGGEPDAWRALMQAETWYVGGDEIVATGLADAVTEAAPAVAPAPAEDAMAFAAWDLSIYAKAPKPAVPATQAPTQSTEPVPVVAAVQQPGLALAFDPDVFRRALKEARI